MRERTLPRTFFLWKPAGLKGPPPLLFWPAGRPVRHSARALRILLVQVQNCAFCVGKERSLARWLAGCMTDRPPTVSELNAAATLICT